MLSFLVDGLGMIFGWLASVLPGSPFAEFIASVDSMGKAFHWLNWVLPIGNFMTIFTAYLVALVTWQAVESVFGGALGRLGEVTGASE